MFIYKLRNVLILSSIIPISIYGQSGPTPEDYRDFANCAHKVKTEHCISRVKTYFKTNCGSPGSCTDIDENTFIENCKLPKSFSGVVTDEDRKSYKRGIEKLKADKLGKAEEEFSSITQSGTPPKVAFWLSYIYGLRDEYSVSLSFEKNARAALDDLGETKAAQLDKIYLWGLYNEFLKHMGEDFFGYLGDAPNPDLALNNARIERRGGDRDLLKCFSKIPGVTKSPCDADRLMPVDKATWPDTKEPEWAELLESPTKEPASLELRDLLPIEKDELVELRRQCENWIYELSPEFPIIVVEHEDSL